MMQLVHVLIAILLLLSLPSLVLVKGNSISKEVRQNLTVGSSSSPWLNKIVNHNSGDDLRGPGCWNKPWICDQGEFQPRRQCCRNRCIDVSSDVNNCGACGLRCLFNWQCCRGQCTNTNISPFNCGKCENICPFRVPCFYGMCGYAQPFPPRPPFPFPPKPPLPPFPFPPPHPPFPFPPKPPHPPFPFPPKPPQPKPPHPPLPPHPQKGWQPPATQ
ncbi:hypothetical protein FH972_020295 [Carpinus fangiana]|uniref:Stigma-specific protein Stig1 n=1 Tax=Carpinus fangiana TaxID=176857 RepID=A0A5N6RX66_9ROSI|nr:hypothetical protein FH972_020295 [Carpinus fangiana]